MFGCAYQTRISKIGLDRMGQLGYTQLYKNIVF